LKRILILGGSGFIGNALYRELSPYYNTFATYYASKQFKKNQHFYHFDHTQEDVNEVLKKVKPKLIISAVRGAFDHQIDLHQQLDLLFALKAGHHKWSLHRLIRLLPLASHYRKEQVYGGYRLK